MQLPIGIIADRLDRNHLIAGAGCVLVAAAFGLTGVPLLATIFVGLGNGMFHIGGGIDILNISEEKSSALGIFVSPGAFGIYFGTILGRGEVALSLPVIMLLLLAAWYILTMKREHNLQTPSFIKQNKSIAIASNAPFVVVMTKTMIIIMICLFLVVCLRSYVGLAIEFPWRSMGFWGFALVCASAFGKTMGGFLSDRFGALKTAILSLGIASILFLIPQIPVAGVSAILLFNMTMPITLWYMAKTFPGAKGFAFGLLTFALFIGFLPVYLEMNTPPFWVFAPLAVISLVLLVFGIMKKDKLK